MSEAETTPTNGLHLTNTMTRRKDPFIPRFPDGSVRIFTCGPSIYSRPHIGNYRTFLFEDILVRYLEYLGHRVERMINYTDVEDKSVQKAEKEGITNEELTEPVARKFREECKVLKIKLPAEIPRSSTSVDKAVELIQRLIESGHAYWHGGDVFFDPLKFEGFGKLFRLDMSRWPKKKVRFRKDTYRGHRWNLGDFILWHGNKGNDEIHWDTEIGKGRPAWNIQDPAMITKHLGYEIDIACGGIDNLYRHHDYNIAVIESISGRPFATYWLHGEHVLVDGTKMSKSRNNEVFLEDLLERGHGPSHARLLLIFPHYREKFNLTEDCRAERFEQLERFKNAVETLHRGRGSRGSAAAAGESDLTAIFERRMNDDLDVQGAFTEVGRSLERLVERKARGDVGDAQINAAMAAIKRIDGVLRIL